MRDGNEGAGRVSGLALAKPTADQLQRIKRCLNPVQKPITWWALT